MELALGTVQFGLPYGLAGRDSPVPETEVRRILQRAAHLGIRMLDTAQAYGEIQGRLARLAGTESFRIVTKLPAVPTHLSADESAEWVGTSLVRAQRELGESLYAVMFHRAEDLLEARGPAMWERCTFWAERVGCKLGVSCYDSEVLGRVCERYPVRIAQVPCNVLDQRLRVALQEQRPTLEIHIRSVFLQGLLLLPSEQAVLRVPASHSALRRWHEWLRDRSLQPLEAALGFVKGLPGVSHCVVGVDGIEQLDAIAQAWSNAQPLHADALACLEPDVIDPRRWPRTP